MITLKQLRNCDTIEDLKSLEIGELIVDVGHRGGGLGFYGNAVAAFFGINDSDLPYSYGACCNYLGGGLRGSIFVSGYNKSITGKTSKLLDELALACVRAYQNEENRIGLNNETYPDGETNWESLGTKKIRQSRQTSAY